MKVIEEGHVYSLQEIDPDLNVEVKERQTITFVKRFRGEQNHSGTINQELLRVLIHRVKFLDAEVPWDGNKDILYHLRMALILHEGRALVRKSHKGDIKAEDIQVAPDGHFKLNKEE